MIFTCDSYFQSLNTPLGNRPLCFRTTVAGRGVLLQKTATMKTANKNQSEYATWIAIKQRCCNPLSTSYPRYGGRGINVCKRWIDSFENFLLDMGKKPSSKHSIERKNNSGNYDPDNCVWATSKEQANNRRNNTVLTHNGKIQTISQWAFEVGISAAAISARLEDGWTHSRALSEPIWNCITLNGKTQTIRAWAREIGVDDTAIHSRLRSGWSIERALTTPKDSRYSKLPRVIERKTK